MALLTRAPISMTSPRGMYTSMKNPDLQALRTMRTPWGSSVMRNSTITVMSILVVRLCSCSLWLLEADTLRKSFRCFIFTRIWYSRRDPNTNIRAHGMSLARMAYIHTLVNTRGSVLFVPSLSASST